MLDAVKRSLERTFDYDGRSGRGEYYAYFFAALVGFMVSAGTLALLIAVPGFAATVRRLHDMDRSGKWALLPVSPVLFLLATVLVGVSEPLWSGTMLAIVFVPIGFVVWMSWPGTPGPNRYGPPAGWEAAEPLP